MKKPKSKAKIEEQPLVPPRKFVRYWRRTGALFWRARPVRPAP